ncbi:MAG: YicC family protein [Bacteroidales bacterium]|nr:YicC family protein [Bacteroidales bacterium]
MIKSMTGFGKSETALAGGKLYVEIRSLNGKTADISIKTSLLPKDREIEVRKMIAAGLERGNIDFFMTYEPNAAESARAINPDIVMNYYNQISGIRQRLGLSNAGSDQEILASILRFQDVMSAKKEDVINDDNWNKVENCIKEAISHLNEFRSKEGAILYRDVTSKVASILACVDEVEKFEKGRAELVRERILSRFAELKLEPDQSRLEAEMIYYIEKLDINEEKVRLRQHCRYFLDTIEKDPFPGKKLGFIAQEMGREINTTGSKANNTDIQKLVVNMKDDLEKIKEQSLNIL